MRVLFFAVFLFLVAVTLSALNVTVTFGTPAPAPRPTPIPAAPYRPAYPPAEDVAIPVPFPPKPPAPKAAMPTLADFREVIREEIVPVKADLASLDKKADAGALEMEKQKQRADELAKAVSRAHIRIDTLSREVQKLQGEVKRPVPPAPVNTAKPVSRPAPSWNTRLIEVKLPCGRIVSVEPPRDGPMRLVCKNCGQSAVIQP